MVDARQDPNYNPAQRIADRLKNSGRSDGAMKNALTPTRTVQTGNSARRTFTNVHESHGEHGARIQNPGGRNVKGNV